MKHTNINIISLLLLCCTHLMLFTMDHKPLLGTKRQDTELSIIKTKTPSTTNQHNTEKAFDEIINNLDMCIKNQYGGLNSIDIVQAQAILNTVGNYYGNKLKLTDRIIYTLYDTNNLFKKVITFFEKHAQENLNAVTCNTLDIVCDPAQNQPQNFEALDKLPQSIKAYVMNRAYHSISNEYDMILSRHTQNILAFDICCATDQAATSSDDIPLFLWDLKTLTGVMLNEQKAPLHIRFHTTGSQLATVTQQGPITVWCPKTKTKLHSIDVHRTIAQLCKTLADENSCYNIANLTYLISESNITLQVLCLAKVGLQGPILSWNFDTQTPDYRGYMFGSVDMSADFIDAKYCASSPQNSFFDRKNLYIKKKLCPALYLCKRAIQTEKNKESLENIKKTLLYNELTVHEKKIVNEKISRRIELLEKQNNILSWLL